MAGQESIGSAQGIAFGVRRAVRRLFGRAPDPWRSLEEGGWSVPAGTLEVQVRRAPDVGWQVELRDSVQGRPLGRPTFSPRLDDAARIAAWLRARYAPPGPQG